MDNTTRLLTYAGWIEVEAGWRHPDTDEEIYTTQQALEEEACMDTVYGAIADLQLRIKAFHGNL